MSLSETYSRVRVGKNVSDRFPIRNGLKQGDALTPVLSNFALEYAIRRVQVNQDGLAPRNSGLHRTCLRHIQTVNKFTASKQHFQTHYKIPYINQCG